MSAFVTLLLASLAAPLPSAAAQPRIPNILLITVDNVGYGDIGCFGSTFIRTPHVDRLAQEGVRLTDFYTASPTCTVSRASLMTGRYPQRHGLVRQLISEPYRGPAEDLAVMGNMGIGLPHRERTIAHYLHDAGYATGAYGKWNLGFAPGSRPTERGFDEYIGIASGNANHFHHIYAGRPDLFHNTTPINRDGSYSSDLWAASAIAFMKRNAAKPFFLYLPFNASHYNSQKNLKPGEKLEVWQVPTTYLEQYGYDPAKPDERIRYAAMNTAWDNAMGRVLAALDDLGLRENTLVIWYSDNGAFKDAIESGVASNAPLRQWGSSLWEGGIRVPAVVRWPGVIAPGTVVSEPLISIDLFVLALKTAGLPLPADRVIDGRDPLPTLQGETRSPHDALFFEYRGQRAVRRGQYKLVTATTRDEDWELYDLVNDVGETTNLAPKKPQLAVELRRCFEIWRDAVSE